MTRCFISGLAFSVALVAAPLPFQTATAFATGETSVAAVQTAPVTAEVSTVRSGPGTDASKKAIRWNEYLADALRISRESSKPVMVDARTAWCGWCKKMDRETFSDPAVIELSASFVCLRVNPDEDEIFSSKYPVKEFPMVIFLRGDGTEIERHAGYKTASDFAAIMKGVLGGKK